MHCVQVVVDDYVAIAEDSRAYTWPQYAAPGRASELWPMLLEKAYAKVHGAWDAIDGGVGYNALQDLTGSLCYTLDLYRRWGLPLWIVVTPCWRAPLSILCVASLPLPSPGCIGRGRGPEHCVKGGIGSVGLVPKAVAGLAHGILEGWKVRQRT